MVTSWPDVEFYAEHFQADGLSLLIESLGAADTSDVRDAIAGHRAFFNSQERLGKFVSIVPHAQGGSEVLTGMIAVLLGCPSRRNEEIVRAYALALADDEAKASMLGQLEKYGLVDAMGRYLHQVTGYEGPLDSQSAVREQPAFIGVFRNRARSDDGRVGRQVLTCIRDVLPGYRARLDGGRRGGAASALRGHA